MKHADSLKNTLIDNASEVVKKVYDSVTKEFKKLAKFSNDWIKQADEFANQFLNVEVVKSDFLTMLADYFTEDSWRVRHRALMSIQLII